MGDDGIAINGHYHLVLTAEGNRLQVVDKFGRDADFSVGDEVELVSFTGERLPNARIESVSKAPGLTVEQRSFISGLNIRPDTKQLMAQASETLQIVINRSVDLPGGSLIAAANRLGNGFEIVGCTLGPTRSRGIVAKASDGIIRNNTLVGTFGEAILITSNYWWLEAGSSSNVVIESNSISGSLDAAIALISQGGNRQMSPAGAFNNISILNNSISNSVQPAIAATSIKGLELRGNSISSPVSSDSIEPWRMSKHGRRTDPSRDVFLQNNE